tara:strand:- start:547 stop:2604 length:2058 start_codon:yes stop_codon:yes gene_type:complete
MATKAQVDEAKMVLTNKIRNAMKEGDTARAETLGKQYLELEDLVTAGGVTPEDPKKVNIEVPLSGDEEGSKAVSNTTVGPNRLSGPSAGPQLPSLEIPLLTSARGLASVNPDGSDEQSMDGGRNSGRRPQATDNTYFNQYPREGSQAAIKQYTDVGLRADQIQRMDPTVTNRELDQAGVPRGIDVFNSGSVYGPNSSVGRIARAWGLREDEWDAMQKRYATGETSTLSAVNQTVGKQFLGRLMDVAGVGMVDAMKMAVPDFLESPIADKMVEGFEYVGGTGFGKEVLATWNSFDENEKANWESLGNFAAVFTSARWNPKVPRGDLMRMNQLGEMFDPPKTHGVKKKDLANLGVRSPEDQAVLDTMGKIKGINPYTGPFTSRWKKNIQVINGLRGKGGEFNKIEALLQKQLSKVRIPMRVDAVKKQILGSVNKYIDDKGSSVFTGDKAIRSAFDVHINKMMALLDESADAMGNIQASDLLVARRALDSSIRASKPDAMMPKFETAGSAATRVTRTSTKEILEEAVNASGTSLFGKKRSILPTFKRFNHTLLAFDNLLENALDKRSLVDSIIKGANDHPILSYTIAGALVSAGFSPSAEGLGAITAATALLAGTVATRGVLSRKYPAAIQGAYMGPIDKGIEAVEDAIGQKPTNLMRQFTPRAIVQEGVDRTNEEIQYRKRRGMFNG